MTVARDLPVRHARYTRVASALHWVVAALIVFNLAVGPFMEGMAEPLRTTLARLHESSGITILVLTVVRIGWRLTHRPPPLDATLPSRERIAAKGVHAIFYCAMVAMPILGWAIVSAHPPQSVVTRPAAPAVKPKRILLWGVVPLIPLKPIQDIALEPGGKARQQAVHADLVRAHALGGYLLMALLALHLLGALKHEWLDGHGGLYRMGLGQHPTDASE